MPQNYDEALASLSASAQLQEKFLNQLSPKEQAKLLEDILLGRASDSLVEHIRIQEDAPPTAKYMSGPDLAFDWLCRQEEAWLDGHRETIERLFKAHYLSELHSSVQCYSRINLIVDRCKIGLSISFLKKCLEEDAKALNRKPRIETELYLLIAKLVQAGGASVDVDADFWKNVKAEAKVKPWLLAVLCYIYRTREFRFFLEVLMDFDEVMDSYGHSLEALEEVKYYLMLYIRQAFYQNLTSEHEDSLGRYTTFEKDIKSVVLKTLIGEVLQVKAMEKVQEALKRHADAAASRNREKIHKDQLAIIDSRALDS